LGGFFVFCFFFFTLKIPHWSFVFQRGRFICEPCRLWQGNFLFSFVFFFFFTGDCARMLTPDLFSYAYSTTLYYTILTWSNPVEYSHEQLE
jgi:hypothetical protein